MAIIEVKYEELDKVVTSVQSLSEKVDQEKANYIKLIKNIANYPEWEGMEKGRILSAASGSYYNYFNGVKENVDDYKKQISSKITDFMNAEK